MSPKPPTFLIVGAAKCGTTALASILDSLPDCCMARPKEVSFFQDNIDFKPNPNYQMGWSWYQHAFSHYANEKIVGEATPSYSDRKRSPATAQRIHKFNPEMKIIYMVRDPLERQISAWKMQYYFGVSRKEQSEIETKWAIDGFDYWMAKQKEAGQWSVCCYSWQLMAYQELFAANQIHVSVLEDWSGDKETEVTRIFSFLGLDPQKWDRSVKESANRAIDRSVDRPWIQTIREQSHLKSVVSCIPSSLKSMVPKKLIRKPMVIPSVDMNSTVVDDFIEHVRPDCLAFLHQLGRSESVWPCLSRHVENT